MKRAVLTKFTQDFGTNGVVNQVQVTYSNYEGSQSFNATVNLTEADGIPDMTRMNVVQADTFARKKLRDILLQPGIGELEEEEEPTLEEPEEPVVEPEEA